ncbi:sensor histidine kinase [Patescibacteria group bacterium]
MKAIRENDILFLMPRKNKKNGLISKLAKFPSGMTMETRSWSRLMLAIFIFVTVITIFFRSFLTLESVLILLLMVMIVLIDKVFSHNESQKEIQKITGELKKTNLKLQELSALKDEFVSVASHELRAPMTTIKGYLAMILEGDAGKIPPRVKEFLESAYNSNDRMIRLVNNMLNVSRIESGRLIMSLDDIHLESVIESVVKEYQYEAKKHGLSLKYEKSKKKLPKVRVDPDRIREIIANLIGNGINFTPHGQVLVRNRLQEGMLITEVEDSGVGISRQNQKGLFKKFSQINGAHAPMKKGSGLGLYICKMLISEFGGKIWLKSRLSKGTTFYFSLPVIET